MVAIRRRPRRWIRRRGRVVWSRVSAPAAPPPAAERNISVFQGPTHNMKNELVVLEGFEARLNELMDMIPKDGRLTPPLKDTLQRLYASLKADMKAVAKQKSPVGAVIAEAVCRMRAATNSHPIESDWFDGLYSARCDVKYAISDRSRK